MSAIGSEVRVEPSPVISNDGTLAKRLDIRVLSTAFLIFAIIIWMATAALVVAMRSAVIEDNYRLLESVSQLLAERTQAVLGRCEATLDRAVKALESDSRPDRVQRLVASGFLAMQDAVQIAFTDPDGIVVGNEEGPSLARVDLHDREHIRKALDPHFEGAFLGKPVIGRVSGKWSIQLTKRFLRADGSIGGVVVVSIDPKFLSTKLRAERGVRVTSELIGLDGALRARSANVEATLAASIDRQAEAARAAGGGASRFMTNGSEKAPMLGAYQTLPNVAAFIESTTPLDEALKPTQRGTSLLLLSSAVLTLVVIGVWSFLARTAIRMHHLMESESQSKARLVEAVNSMRDAFVICDADGRVALVNDAYRQMFANNGHERRSEDAWLLQAALGERAFDVQLGDGRWLRVTNTRSHNGDIIGVRSDITSTKTYELMLAKNQEDLARYAEESARLAAEAERASRAKSAFVTALSHESRNFISVIVGYAALLSATQLNGEQKDSVNAIQMSARNLQDLTVDMLDLSRIEAGKLTLTSGVVSAAKLVEDVARSLRILVMGKPIAVRCVVDRDVPEWIEGDRARLNQVLTNLAGNAAKFTAQGTITLDVVVIGSAQNAVDLRFSVQDSGAGVPAHVQTSIFDPFDQGGAQGSRALDGVGLGLAICKGLVQLMGGRIGVDSDGRTGSRFWFEARFAKAAPPAPAREAVERPAERPLDILIADDLASSLALLQTMLRKRGHRVTRARDGLEAVAAASRRRFDLAVLDLEMPNLSGLEAARRIRGMDAEVGAPCVAALTAHAYPEDREAALQAGVGMVITKPFSDEDLDRLLGWAHRHAAGSSALVEA